MKTFNSKEAKVRAIQLWPDTVEQVQEALGMDNKYIGNDKTVMVICDTKTGRIVMGITYNVSQNIWKFNFIIVPC